MPNPAYTLDNRGKRSVVLDLRTDDGRVRTDGLLADADVFVTNLKPDVLDKFGLDPDPTSARHPHLVYCSVSGYGLEGPERDRPSYDLGAFWARSGLSYQLARRGEPLNAPLDDWLMIFPPPRSRMSGTAVAVPEMLWEDAGVPPDVPPLFMMAFVEGTALEPLFDLGDAAQDLRDAGAVRQAAGTAGEEIE